LILERQLFEFCFKRK